MSMIIVPHEWKEEKPFVYYSLQIWHDRNNYSDYSNDYTRCEDCTCHLRTMLEKPNNHIELATIRENTIYKRTEQTELSCSSPLIHYDHKTGFRI